MIGAHAQAWNNYRLNVGSWLLVWGGSYEGFGESQSGEVKGRSC